MLVLSRRDGEKIQIGNQITITVVRVSHNAVRIGIEAPPELLILRQEVVPMAAAPAAAPGGASQHEADLAVAS